MPLFDEYVIFIFLSSVKNENFNEYKTLIVFVLYIWRSFFLAWIYKERIWDEHDIRDIKERRSAYLLVI